MGRKLLLEHIDVSGIETYDVYRNHGGYKSVEKALKTMSAQEVVEEVQKSALRGRGGAGFPTGMKWSFLAKPEGVPRYLVCNADESEPGTFKDRFLMEKLPHLMVEGMITSSYALGANTAYIYIRGEYMFVQDILEKAIADYNEAIRISPQYDKAYYNRGVAWGRKGEYEKAILDYSEAIRLSPQLPNAYAGRGDIYLKKRN